MSDSVYKVGDRVRVTKVKWYGATDEEKAIVGREGTVVEQPDYGIGLFVRVRLDDMPDWWEEPDGLPLVEDELELVK